MTQCCPSTSDLPESSERAGPSLTTQIQLSNQAREGMKERMVAREDGQRGRKKIIQSLPFCGSPSSLPHFDPSSPCCLLPFVALLCFLYRHLHPPPHRCAILVRLYSFHNACGKGQDRGEKRCSMAGCSERSGAI